MKELTEDLVLEAYLVHIDIRGEDALEYQEAFQKTLNRIRNLNDDEMLCRVYDLNQGHRGWWIETEDGTTGVISDLQMPKVEDRTWYNDDRIVVIDGTIHNLERRSLVVVSRVKAPTGEDS